MAAPNAGLATKAFVYGFPLVFNLDQVNRYVSTGIGANPAAPFNRFSHARTLATPADHFVSLNNDTVYSMCQVDLSEGPQLLDVPASIDRYFVLQFVSAWTDNFAYIGTRGTGSEAAKYLLVPPGWDGALPDGTELVRFPTTVASIVGRRAVSGPDDLPAVHALQDATILSPHGDSTEGQGVAEVAEGPSEALTFFEKYRVWSQQFPPAPRDQGIWESLAPLGLTGASHVWEQEPAIVEALEAGYAGGKARIQAELHGGHAEVINGWQMVLHSFDYNLDYFSVGTIDAPEWKIADPDARLFVRAAAAMGGLWGNQAYEAAYFSVYEDSNGEPLSGEHEYTLTLDPTPPNDGFWSLTMYDAEVFYMVDNPINRYSLGDRTPGIVYGDRGEIVIHISHRQPADPTAAANWLPAPAGPFRPVLRVYIPGQEILSGVYTFPAMQRVDR